MQIIYLIMVRSCFLQKTISSEHTDQNVKLKPTVLFRTTPTHLEIVITWCYRKPFHIVVSPCKVSNPTHIGNVVWFDVQGLKEEKSVYERASSRNIYLNLSVNTLKRLRSAQTTDTPDKVTSPTSKGSISHEAVIGGKAATQHTFTLNRSHQSTAQLPKYEGKSNMILY